MIDLRGLSVEQATLRLEEFRDVVAQPITWTFNDIIVSNPASIGTVISTTPGRGSPVGPNESIIVRIGVAP